MRVILINPPSDCVNDDRLEPPLGLLYIAAVLREHAVLVELYDMTGCKTDEQIVWKIGNIPEGDIFALTTYCTNYMYVKRCIQFIRSRSKQALIVLGGPNPTAMPEYTLKDSSCDTVITGEGEDALLYVCQSFLKGVISPPIFSGLGRTNVDSYPMPAWDLCDLHDYNRLLEGERVISLISSRGCKYNCAHCNSIVMGGGNKVRYRSPQNLGREITHLKRKGFQNFRFNDDNFTGNPNLKMLTYQINKLEIKYRIFARIEDLTRENCRYLAESGCRHVAIGLETLNPDNLIILGKATQSGNEERNLQNAKKSGLIVRAYFMVGLPYDTDETIHKYFERASRLPFDEFSLYPLIPYPGTMIAREPEKFGYEIEDKDFTGYVQIGKGKKTTFALRHKNFSEKDVKRWFDYIENLFLRNRKILQCNSNIAI